MTIAELIVAMLTGYFAIGALFAVAFVVFAVHRIDPVARHAGIGFRLLIVPGTALLWPWLLHRWIRVKAPS